MKEQESTKREEESTTREEERHKIEEASRSQFKSLQEERKRLTEEFESQRKREQEEYRRREIAMEERFIKMMNDRDQQQSQGPSLAAQAASTTELRMKDMAFVLQRCVAEISSISNKVDTAINRNSKPVDPIPIHTPPEKTDGPSHQRATLTAKPSTSRTTPSSDRRSNRKEEAQLPSGFVLMTSLSQVVCSTAALQPLPSK